MQRRLSSCVSSGGASSQLEEEEGRLRSAPEGSPAPRLPQSPCPALGREDAGAAEARPQIHIGGLIPPRCCSRCLSLSPPWV